MGFLPLDTALVIALSTLSLSKKLSLNLKTIKRQTKLVTVKRRALSKYTCSQIIGLYDAIIEIITIMNVYKILIKDEPIFAVYLLRGERIWWFVTKSFDVFVIN